MVLTREVRMVLSQSSGTRLALAVCCGVLAVPATASADHMGDMPWCPHSDVQGADPADSLPGGAGGSTAAGPPSSAPLRASVSSAPAANAPAQSARPSTSTQVRSGSASQNATAGRAATSVAVARTTVAAAAPVQAPGSTSATLTGTVPARAVPDPVEKARARAEARGLARAVARQRAERSRAERGARIVVQTQLSTSERWLAEPVTSTGEGGVPPWLPAGVLALLLAGAGLTLVRRRGGGAATAVAAERAPLDPTPEAASAIEAELQEIIAEERAARAARERSGIEA